MRWWNNGQSTSRSGSFMGIARSSHESFEPKEINFCDLAAVHHPGRQWHEISQPDQVALIRGALKADHFLLNPHSEYMKYWDLVIALALIFTGIVTPYEVIFTRGSAGFTDALFIINRCVDGIFIKDMCMQFFLKTETIAKGRGGKHMLKEPWKIRKQYCTGWFMIDFVSILPFDLFILTFEVSDSMKSMKILRCLRLLRLVKLVRILRTSRLILRWQNFLAVSFASQKLAKFSFILMLCSHWMACFWGLVGLSYGMELCDEEGNQIEMAGDIPLEEVSWITTLFTGGKNSPDNPCNPMHVYTAALHWSVMTITSIGYGDIVPVRNVEYWAGISGMLAGGICWAYIIGSACGIISNVDPIEGRFEQNTDLLNTMMREVSVPKARRQYYREYLREAKAFDTIENFRMLATNFSPLLKGELLLFFSSQWKKTVFYLANAPERLIMDMAEQLQPSFFSRKEQMHNIQCCLCVVERGTLASSGTILMPGSSFHEDFIVCNPRLRKDRATVSLTYSLILKLKREDFFDVLERYPRYKGVIRRAATRMALFRAVILCSRKHQERRNAALAKRSPNAEINDEVSKNPSCFSIEGEWPSLMDMFEVIAKEEHQKQDILEFEATQTTDGPDGLESKNRSTSAMSGLGPLGVEITQENFKGNRASNPKEAIDAVEACLMATTASVQQQLEDMKQKLKDLKSMVPNEVHYNSYGSNEALVAV